MAYSEKLVQHFENPKNVGTISSDPNNKEVGTGLVGAGVIFGDSVTAPQLVPPPTQ